MYALAIAAILLGPAGPGSANDTETPQGRTPIDGGFAPVHIEPPPPRPPVESPRAEASSPEAPVPPPDTTARAVRLDAPPPGNGRVVGGFCAMGLGIATLVIVIRGVDRKDLESDPPAFTATFASLGILSLGAGALLVARGARARTEFDKWRASSTIGMRKNGSGLIVGGTMATVFGSGTLIAASIATRDPNIPSYDRVPPLLGISAVVSAAGIGALSWGLVRRNRYQTWRASTFAGSSVPILVPLHRGAGIGLVGQF